MPQLVGTKAFPETLHDVLEQVFETTFRKADIHGK